MSKYEMAGCAGRRVVVSERNRQIYESRMAGTTYADLGRQHGISSHRVRQIVLRVGQIVKRNELIASL